MDWASAPSIGDGSLPLARGRLSGRFTRVLQSVELFLDEQGEQLPLWSVVGLGMGIGLWFWLPGPRQWEAVMCLAAGVTIAGAAFVPGRLGKVLLWLGIMTFAGMALSWARSEWVAAPRLNQPKVVSFSATVIAAEPRLADGKLRLTLAPHDATLPPQVRTTMDLAKVRFGLNDGAQVQLRARLAPPPPMALPGSHDFARDAWFMGLGAVGKALGEVVVAHPAAPSGLDGVRNRLDNHIQ